MRPIVGTSTGDFELQSATARIAGEDRGEAFAQFGADFPDTAFQVRFTAFNLCLPSVDLFPCGEVSRAIAVRFLDAGVSLGMPANQARQLLCFEKGLARLVRNLRFERFPLDDILPCSHIENHPFALVVSRTL